MSFLHSNDDKGNTASFMNNRIPRKKTLTYSGSKSTVDTVFNTAKQSTAANDTLSSFRIPRKSKDGAPSNDKKRTHDMSTSIATTKVTKKVKATATPRDNIVDSIPPPVNDKDVPTYQIVKEGRISGYPIIVSQVGSEHDAILLGCKATDNPQEYLDNNKDGKVKIRWKFAGYNGLVPTNTVRLKVVDRAPPIRKAAVLSGLLETGDSELNANKDDIDLEEDDDAPILKAVRSELLDNTSRADKDGDYNDQEDRDEKLVCYERSASVGYQGGKTRIAVASTGINDGSLTNNQHDLGSEEVSAVKSQYHEELLPMEVKSDMNVTSVVVSGMHIKSEGEDTDDEIDIKPIASNSDVKTETEAVYECATDNDEPKPLEVTSHILEVTSDINVKTVRVDNDNDLLRAKNVSPDCSETKRKSGNVSEHTQSLEKRGYYEHFSMGTPGSNNKEYVYISNTVGKSRKERKFRRSKRTIKVEAFSKIQHIEDANDMLIPKDDWKEMHQEGNLNMVATDEHGKFIAAKITRNSVQTDLRGKRGFEKMRETLSILDEYGIKHSENDDGSTVYDMIGKDCKDPQKNGVLIDYAFKEGTPDNIIRQAKDEVKEIVGMMETCGERVTKHIYDDYRFSYLSCLSKDEAGGVDSIIYYFVFPEYKLKIPMKSGDVIVLNTSVTHSFSNCEQPAYLLRVYEYESSRTDVQQLAWEEERKKRMKKEELWRKEQRERQKERVCSVCKLSKNLHDDYVKKQRSKGDNATCKKCTKDSLKLKAQRICCSCNKSKSLDNYSKSQRGKGDNARCKDCTAGLPY